MASCVSLANQEHPLLMIYEKTIRRSLLDRGHANRGPERSMFSDKQMANRAQNRQGPRETQINDSTVAPTGPDDLLFITKGRNGKNTPWGPWASCASLVAQTSRARCLVKYRSDSTRSIGVPRTAIFDLFFEFPRLRNERAHNDHWKDTTKFFTA